MKEIAGKQRQPAWFGLDRRYGGKVEAYVGRRAAEFEPAACIWPMRIVRHDEIERGRDYAFRVDMPRFCEFYLEGKLKLDDMISRRIKLDQINEAFDEMKQGEVARSVIVFD